MSRVRFLQPAPSLLDPQARPDFRSSLALRAAVRLANPMGSRLVYRGAPFFPVLPHVRSVDPPPDQVRVRAGGRRCEPFRFETGRSARTTILPSLALRIFARMLQALA